MNMKSCEIGSVLDVLEGNAIVEIMGLVFFLTTCYGKFHTNTKVEKVT